MVVGADGCRAGWFAVALEGRTLTFRVHPDFRSLCAEYAGAQRILVDIPIGLPGNRPRRCDNEARRLLGPRRGSVFPVPCREAVHAKDYRSVVAANEKAMGRRISQQAWNICGKIAEVDRLLRRQPPLRGIVHESHPELCFWALAGGRAMSWPKRTGAGQRERTELLANLVPGAGDLIRVAREHDVARRSVANDDILDALCLAVTAACPAPLPQVPATPEFDPLGLEMKIAYGGCCSLQRPAPPFRQA